MPPFLQTFDESILLFTQQYIRNSFLTPCMQWISSFFDRGLLSIVTCILLLAFHRTRQIGYAATLSLSLSTIITNITLKPLVARPRPYHVLEQLVTLAHRPSDFSFPSGHTTAAFAVAGVLFFCCPKRYGVPALILAILVGLSRIYLGIHFPSDVMMGTLVGMGTSYVAFRIVNGNNRSFNESKSKK